MYSLYVRISDVDILVVPIGHTLFTSLNIILEIEEEDIGFLVLKMKKPKQVYARLFEFDYKNHSKSRENFDIICQMTTILPNPG